MVKDKTEANSMKKVSLVILHFKEIKLTNQCLESVEKLHCPKGLELQTIVVNNNSQENLKDLERKFRDFVFTETKKNLGFTGGNNVGIKKGLEGGAEFLFIVNNDTILDKNLLVQLVKAAGSDEKIGLLAPKVYFAPGYEYHQERYKPADRGRVIWYAGGLVDWNNVLASHRGMDEIDEGQYDEMEETEFISGCAMFIKGEVFEKVGLLDERYFLYLEDADFCQKAKKAGFKLIYVPKAKLWHANAASSKVGGSLQDYYFTRNRMLFGRQYAPLRTKFALFRESLRLLFTGRKWQRIGIRDFYLSKFGKGSYKGN